MILRFLRSLIAAFRPVLREEDERVATADDCETCGGTGAIEALGPTRCPVCRGSGKKPVTGAQ
jgi:DnaJ-class molecular chaperone